MTVLVAHPTRQHSHRLAQALENAGLLDSYWTMLPDRRALAWLPTALDGGLPTAVMRHSLQFLPVDKVHALIGPLLFQKLASRSAAVGLRQLGEWLAWTAFDHWVAKQLPRVQPKVVVGYEMCCSETFRVAKSMGITCVLDAAAFHYAFQDKLLDEDKVSARSWAGKRLRQRKQIEIERADKIICVSELARRSYIDAGVDEARIVVNQVGCDVTNFVIHGAAVRAGAPKFVFVGIPGHHKGFDLLISSHVRLLSQFPDAELHVVGDAALAGRLADTEQVHLHGKLSHEQLSKFFSQMDCLVLPSRLESFGMVVVEALAAGVPVIVSDHAGASEAIQEGENGWVVPAGIESALFERMLACCQNIDRVRSMSGTCASSAARHDWSHYSKGSIDILMPLLKGQY